MLLVDDSGSAHVKIRRDLRSVAEEDDAEYLEALGFDLRQKAAELGGRVLDCAGWSRTPRIFCRSPTRRRRPFSWPEADLRRIYSRACPRAGSAVPDASPAVHARRGGRKLGRAMESDQEDWVEAPADFTAHGGHVRRPRRGPVDGAANSRPAACVSSGGMSPARDRAVLS